MTGIRSHVVVVGGGYAGTMAANHLRLRNDVDITLVNPRPQFVERIRLHQLVAGNHPATADYGTLLGDGINLVVDTATRIDPATRTVQFASGRRALHYDYLMYAVGSTGATPAVPGAEFAYPIAEFEYAQRLRDALAELHPDAPVTVVGAGLTGIETAAELAEQGRRVTLVCGGQLAASLSESARRATAKQLAKIGVTVLEDDVVTELRRDAVVFADGAVRPSALTIWTAGFGVPALAADSGLRTDSLGRLLTDETLTSIDDPRIVAAGDCAAPSGQPLRMSCQAAGPLATFAAQTVLSRIAGEEPEVILPKFAGQCVSLGRRAGTVQISHEDDTPTRFYLSGRVAASIKEAICKGTLWGLRREARKPGSAFLFKGSERDTMPEAAPQVVTNP
ncbi:NAD(P)/FAD-dependent oxidoreductase [Mycobacterium sp. 1274761.0]|uniref:NAD(P)/FAD-dependent oxidoreductase n=1 Tax=Mycobacterium sp. 1274761.0 TaxID=1834077 RepID=UPI0008023395|nr:FAD-dependent oxidoreductase [Mycobacterium sp. 1274761.0]OBK80076.1 pyridine nucleotide-disulfide oxidoreductase [Mycobacterium sp. 1274761.0]